MIEDYKHPKSGGTDVYTIIDEDSLWLALYDIVKRESIEGVEVRFEDWVSSKFKVHGKNYNSAMSYSAMRYFTNLQSNVYKSFALAKYGVYKADKLKIE